MTENEAIDVISSAIEQSTQIIVELTNIKNKAEREGRIGEYYANLDNCIKEIDACEVVIKALKEVQQYRAIDTPEECRKAVDKQTAKKTFRDKDNYDFWTCPECKEELYWDSDYGQQEFSHCPNCGQKLDWD